MVSLQVASDLHTEVLDDVLDNISSPAAVIGSLLKPSAPFCILAGDNGSVIGPDLPRFYTLLRGVSASFQHVFVIAGNHEFYNSVREPVLDDDFDWRAPSIVHAGQVSSRLRTLCRAFPNVTYLDRHGGPRWLTADGRVLEAPDPSLPPSAHARLVGCPLWSHVPAHARKSVTKYLNDYRIIVHPPPFWNMGAGATSTMPLDLAPAASAVAAPAASTASTPSTAPAAMPEDGHDDHADSDGDDGSSGAGGSAAGPGLFRALDFGSPDKASSSAGGAAAGGAGASTGSAAAASPAGPGPAAAAPVLGGPLPGLAPRAPAAAPAAAPAGPALLPLPPALEAALQAADLLGAPPGYSRLTPEAERDRRRSQQSRFPNPASVEARRAAVADFLDAEHAADLAYLVRQAEASTDRGDGACIVVTHHAPTFHGTSAPRFRTPLHNPTNHGFASDLAYLFARYGCDDTHTHAGHGHAASAAAAAGAGAGASGSGSGARATGATAAAAAAATGAPAYNSNVRLWVYGHTHFNCDQTLYGTRVVSNQRGYSWTAPGEGGEDGSGPEYRQDFVVDVPLPPL